MKKLFVTLSLIALLVASTGAAFAAGSESNCQIVYGGGQICENKVKFTINKLVQTPNKGGNFVENLTINDPRLTPGQNVNFKIVIENTGDRDITNLNVVDTFPQFLTFVAGVGNANAGANQVNFVIGSLKKGQKVEYVLTAKAADAGNLPSNQAITCVTNNVKATAADGSQAEDNSQVCIEKTVSQNVPTTEIQQKPMVKTIPATGPELAALFGLIPMGAAGFYIKRKAN